MTIPFYKVKQTLIVHTVEETICLFCKSSSFSSRYREWRWEKTFISAFPILQHLEYEAIPLWAIFIFVDKHNNIWEHKAPQLFNSEIKWNGRSETLHSLSFHPISSFFINHSILHWSEWLEWPPSKLFPRICWCG